MTMRTNLLILPLACLSLAGCVGGLLGGGKPAQLFRFGSATPVTDTDAPASARIVALAPVQFAPEIEGDRLLATEGAKVFYIKEARWIAPTPILFEQALRDAFRLRAPTIMLAERRSAISADRVLQIAVERFEAGYAAPGTAPAVRIAARVSMIDAKTRLPVAGFELDEAQPAAANDIDSIVAAFDAASARAVAKVADWTRSGALP